MQILFCLRKNVLLLMLGVLLAMPAYPQDNAKLQARIDSLEKRLDEKNYTRIPNEDFDEKLNAKVSSVIWEQGKNLMWLIGGITALLGALVVFYVKISARKIADENIKSITANVNERVDKNMEESLSFLWNDLANNVVERARKAEFRDSPNGENFINDLRKFLDTEKIKLSDADKGKVISTLIRCYFETKMADYPNEMIRVIKKYEKEYKIEPDSYLNAAIAQFVQLRDYGKKEYYDACIEYSENSLRRLNDYGEAYAIMLEANAVIHVNKGEYVKPKEKILSDMKNIFDEIENNPSNYLPREIIARLEIDKENPRSKKYVAFIEEQFSNEISAIRARLAANMPANTPAT